MAATHHGAVFRLLSGNSCFSSKFRLLSTFGNRIEENRTKTKPMPPSHCYRNLYPWTTLDEFGKNILSCIVYNKGGLIVINKPYGVAIQRYQEGEDDKPKSIKTTLMASSIGESHHSLDCALPFLRDHLNEKDLFIVKSAERYTSGITVLATSEKVRDHVKRSMQTARTYKTPPLTYWCVTLGHTIPPNITERVGIMLQTVDKTNKQPVIVHNVSNQQMKAGLIKTVQVQLNTIAFNQHINMSLLSIKATRTKWHFPRVYSTDKGVGILGDNLFGPRVRWLFNKTFKISVHNNAAYEPPSIPERVQEQLELDSSDILNIPTHLHLQSCFLPKFGRNKEELVIEAQPPTHFSWTCQKLHLNPPLQKQKLVIEA